MRLFVSQEEWTKFCEENCVVRYRGPVSFPALVAIMKPNEHAEPEPVACVYPENAAVLLEAVQNLRGPDFLETMMDNVRGWMRQHVAPEALQGAALVVKASGRYRVGVFDEFEEADCAMGAAMLTRLATVDFDGDDSIQPSVVADKIERV